jgi:hypothetical protein
MSYNILKTSCCIDNTSARTSNQKFLDFYAPVYYEKNNCFSCFLEDSDTVMYDNSFVNNNLQNKFQTNEDGGGQTPKYIRKEIDRIRRALHQKRMAKQSSQSSEEFEDTNSNDKNCCTR